MPLVSIIIPNYNYGNYLPACLDSILGNEHQDYEAIVVDDCSTENQIPDCLSVPKVTVIKNAKNLGTAGTINAGLRACHGEYIMIVSADDMITPQSITGRLSVFQKRPDLDVIYGAMHKVGGNVSYKEALASLSSPRLHPSIYTVPLYRRSVFTRFGILHETMRGKEDKEMQYRLGVHEKAYCEPRVKFIRVRWPVYIYRRHDRAQRKHRSKNLMEDIYLYMEFDKRCKDVEINGLNEKNTEFLK